MKSVKDGILPCSIINVTKLTLIDATDVSSSLVADTDYQIRDDGSVEVIDLDTFIVTDFEKFKIKYCAGYETAPADFLGIMATLVGLEYSKDNGRDVTEETT